MTSTILTVSLMTIFNVVISINSMNQSHTTTTYPDSHTTTVYPEPTNLYCGNVDEYACANYYNTPYPCINEQCDTHNNFPVYCGEDSECSNYIGLDFCQWHHQCVPDCRELDDGNGFCNSFVGNNNNEYFCLPESGRCGHERCDYKNDPTCSISGFVCRPQWDHDAQIEVDECIEDCRVKSNSDEWCANYHGDDYSFVCQDYGECQRDECGTGGVCLDIGLVCDPHEGGENGQCVRSCDGNSTLCQTWNMHDSRVDYYVCNNNLCRIEYPTCAVDAECDLGIQTWYEYGFRCDTLNSRRCYEVQCYDDSDCSKHWGGYQGVYCDTITNVCINLWDQRCSEDIDCSNYNGVDFCQDNYFCVPDCREMNDGDAWCNSVFGNDGSNGNNNNGYFCLFESGTCGYGRCDFENDPTCSLTDFICRPRWDHHIQENVDECIEDCRVKLNSDQWCANYHGDDYSVVCQDYGECQRNECEAGGVCSDIGLVCDLHEGGENGQCVRSCNGDLTLCQTWHMHDSRADYYVCNNDLCEIEYPTCRNDGECDSLGVQTWNGYGLKCDTLKSGKCYEVQCYDDSDCSKHWGGDQGVYCDTTTNVCENIWDQDCQIVGCDWVKDILQPHDGGYGIQPSCNITSNKCDKTFCENTADCDIGYWCLTYDQHFCVKECQLVDDCCDIFGCDPDSWECDLNNNECIPQHDHYGCKYDHYCESGKICNLQTNECEVVPCNDNSDCTNIDVAAVCKAGGCAIDDCVTGIDCKQEYFNACYIDPEGGNKCYASCTDNDACDAIFGRNTTCKTGSPCNVTTAGGCEEVGYCDMWDMWDSCVFEQCHESNTICDIPSGNCIIVTCDTDPAICIETFGAFATCDQGECFDNDCLEDVDCTGMVNKCFTQDTEDANKCYSHCVTDDDCTDLYNQDGIICESGDPAGIGVTISFCNVYDNFTLASTKMPETSTTGQATVATISTTETSITCAEDDDLFTIDCEDDGCDADDEQAYLSFNLVFDVCTIQPFIGKRKGLWNRIVDCVCEMGLGANYDGTEFNLDGNLNERRRRLLSDRGSSAGKCDLRIVEYEKPLKIGYSTMDGCSDVDASNSYHLEFGMEGCGACENIKNMWNGFKDVALSEAVDKIKTCAEFIGKERIADGFKVVQVQSFTYTFHVDGDCTLSVSTNGVEREYNNVLSVIFGIMMIYVLL